MPAPAVLRCPCCDCYHAGATRELHGYLILDCPIFGAVAYRAAWPLRSDKLELPPRERRRRTPKNPARRPGRPRKEPLCPS